VDKFPTGGSAIPLKGNVGGAAVVLSEEMWAWGNQQEQANTREFMGRAPSRRSVRKGSGAVRMQIPSLRCNCLGELQGMSRNVLREHCSGEYARTLSTSTFHFRLHYKRGIVILQV